MLINPTSQYAEAAAFAMGRAMDDAILSAATGTAYTGEDGSTTTSFSASMTVPKTARWPGVTSADCGLNVAKLNEAKKLLAMQDVDPDDECYIAVNGRQIHSLLLDEKLSSFDYNNIKPLVDGKVTKSMGFTFLPTNRIGLSGSDDRVVYWARGGILLGVGADVTTKITERADKNYATQVFCAMTIGATRMEEVRVGDIICDIDGGPNGDLD